MINKSQKFLHFSKINETIGQSTKFESFFFLRDYMAYNLRYFQNRLMKLLSISNKLKNKNITNHRNLKQLSYCLVVNLEITLTSTILVEIQDQYSTPKIYFSTQQPSIIWPYHYKIQIIVNCIHHKVSYRSTLIKNNSIFVINSHNLRINLLQKIVKNITNHIQAFTIKINLNTGQIDITLTESFGKLLFDNYNLLGIHIESKIKQLIGLWNNYIYLFLSELNQSERYQHQLISRRAITLQKIKRHIYFSQNDLGLSEKGNQHKCPGQQTTKNRQLIIKRLLQCYDKNEIKEAFMYGYHKVQIKKDSTQWKKQFESPIYFDKLLEIPPQKQLSVGQNCFIYNKIEIIQPETIKSQEFMKTANSIIKRSTISFKYTYQGQNDIRRTEGKEIILSKQLLIKTPKNDTPKQRNKLIHEKRITHIFSSANSPYLFKYYTSEQKFQHKDDVIMDYNPSYMNLLSFISKRKESLGLLSKLTILIHISNSLRFLHYYKVVHMDLNPNNILVNEEYLTKLIDFGESYNHDLVGPHVDVKKLYNPGYTIPYCPPQVFFKNSFDYRQDSFSFGIIMFRVINDVLPLYPSDNIKYIYEKLAYPNHFFLAPQKFKNIAKYEVCQLMMLLQNRCLDQVYQKRPLPIWMTIIIKQLLLYLNM